MTAGSCPLCEGEGLVGFRVCADNESLVLVCETCAHVWTDPSQLDREHAWDLLSPEFGRRYPGLSLVPSRWATSVEVIVHGWGAFMIQDGSSPEATPAPEDSTPA
jgi:hypothetical protein